VRVRFAIFVVLLANAGACGQASGSVQGDGGVDGVTVADVQGSDAEPPCTSKAAVQLEPRAVDVLIVFDGSESMGIAFGQGTRYSVLADVLSDLVDAYQLRIRFGLAQFPGADGSCPGESVMGCCAGPPSVEVALGDGAAVQEALKNAPTLAGNTPTASALRRAFEHYGGLTDGVPDRYVLLATDGLPSCTLSGELSSSQSADGEDGLPNACRDAVSQVDALAGQNIGVLVLAVGAEPNDDPAGPPDCLDQMAQAGGMPKSSTGPGYYSVASPESLQETMEYIFGGLARSSCRFALVPAPDSTAQVTVYLDRDEIPRDQNRENGWDFDPAGERGNVRIFGEYCDRIEHFRYSTIGASYRCPSQCADEMGCP
jgi:hypothetical protein